MVLKILGSILFFAAINPALHGQTFTAVTTGPLVSETGAWRSVNWVDDDRDGDLDLFVTSGLRAARSNLFFRNEGAPGFAFTKVTDGTLVGTPNRGVGRRAVRSSRLDCRRGWLGGTTLAIQPSRRVRRSMDSADSSA